MANTIIRIKSSGVTGNVPQALQPGEIAINYVDGKIFYGNSSNQTVLFDAITEPAGLDGELQFNSFGSFGSDPGLIYNTTNKTLTANNLVVANVNVAPTIISAYIHANSAYEYANALSGGTATDGVARVLANNAQLQANSAYMHANAAFVAANNSVDTWVRSAANSASSYANAAYTQANTATVNAAAASSYANSAFAKANNALANTSGTFAGNLTITGNLIANSITTGGSGSGDISGANVVYANTFVANSNYRFADATVQTTAASPAAFTQAAYLHANAAFVAANNSVDPWVRSAANSASSYANSAYTQANSATILAQAAFDTANTGTPAESFDLLIFFPTGDYGFITDSTEGFGGEILLKEFDCKVGPNIYTGYSMNLDFEYLS